MRRKTMAALSRKFVDDLGVGEDYHPIRVNGKSWKCQKCDYVSSEGQGRAYSHVFSQHLGVKPFKCKNCNFTSADKVSLRQHMTKRCGIERAPQSWKRKKFLELLECDKCEFKSKYPKCLAKHKEKCVGVKIVNPFAPSIVSAKQEEDQPPEMSLEELYSNLGLDVRAYVAETGPKSWECRQCGFSGRWKNPVGYHVLAKHLNLKPFRCDNCPFESSNRAVLNAHIKKGNCGGGNLGTESEGVALASADEDKVIRRSGVKDDYLSGMDDLVLTLGPKMFKCRICPYSTKSPKVARKHFEKRHPETLMNANSSLRA